MTTDALLEQLQLLKARVQVLELDMYSEVAKRLEAIQSLNLPRQLDEAKLEAAALREGKRDALALVTVERIELELKLRVGAAWHRVILEDEMQCLREHGVDRRTKLALDAKTREKK